MIKEFTKAWQENKEELKKYYFDKIQEKNGYYYIDYKEVFKNLIEYVINPYLKENRKWALSTENITEIDNGDYQGTKIFITYKDLYQPGYDDYFVANDYYGSCPGCDSLLYALDSDNDETKANDLVSLSLGLLESMKFIANDNEDYGY